MILIPLLRMAREMHQIEYVFLIELWRCNGSTQLNFILTKCKQCH